MKPPRPRVRPFRPEDLGRLDVVDVQRDALAALRDPMVLIEGGEAWTVVNDETGAEDVRLCSGLHYLAAHRATAWSLVSKAMTWRDWVIAGRAMGARLTILQGAHGLRRVEADVPLDFRDGHRLLTHLGFKFECCLPGFGAGGEIWCRYGRYADRPNLPARYDQCRALAYRTLVEDVIER